LLALREKEGARAVIQKHRAQTEGVPVPAAAIDIDTAADFAALSSEGPGSV
jgi:CTP:molybdopterin cytidylyltransferase MocA